MGLIDTEKGTSEVVGAMLLLAIFIIVLGSIQAYEVPSWNKDLELQQFDRIHNEFLNIRSDIQDVYINNIPKTSSLSMGIRYPERYLLRNPGPGASGTLTYEPVNVNLTINGISLPTYPSTRIRYSMNGISNQPALVYEHGLVIRDIGGNKSFNEGAQTLISVDNINIPVIFTQGQSVGSMLPESLTINPLSTNNYTVIYNNLTIININLQTQYPELWRDLTKNLPGVNVTGTGNAGNITITKNVTNLIYPPRITSGDIYSGMISTQIPTSLRQDQQASYNGLGQGVLTIGTKWNNVPFASQLNGFIINNITTDFCAENCDLTDSIIALRLADMQGHFWFVNIYFAGSSSPTQRIIKITGRTSLGTETNSSIIYFNTTTQLNLLKTFSGNGRYSVSNVNIPNIMVSQWIGAISNMGGNPHCSDPSNQALIYCKLIIN